MTSLQVSHPRAALMRKNLYVALVINLIGSVTGSAQQEQPKPAQPVILSERDAIKRAIGNSRELAAFATAVRAQQSRAGCTSCNLRNPEVRVADISTNYFYADPNVEKQFHVGMRWRPPKLGELGLNEQRETVDLWEIKAKENIYRNELVTEVRMTYAEIAFLEQYRDLTVKETELEERNNAALEGLVNIGQKSLIDRIKARRRLIKARDEASKTARRYLNAKNKLRELTGEKREITAVFGAAPEEVPDFQKLHARAIENTRDLALTEERAKLSELRYRAARYAQIPWFSFVEAGYHHDSRDLDWGELRFGIELPLFSWGSAALETTAIAREGRGQYQAATVESIDRKISDALAQYQEALTEWRSLKAEAESFLPGTDGLVAQARQRPSLPANEIIDLELSAVEIRKAVLEARFALAEASIELCEAVGVERWEDLGK